MKCIFLGRRRLGSSLCAGLQKTAKACQVFIPPMKCNFAKCLKSPKFQGLDGTGPADCGVGHEPGGADGEDPQEARRQRERR